MLLILLKNNNSHFMAFRSQNRSHMAIGTGHGNLSEYRRAKSIQIPPNGTRKNRSRASMLSGKVTTMPTRLPSIHHTFRSSKPGNSNWILPTIRRNQERQRKMSMAYATRPREFMLSGFDALQILSALRTIQRLSKLIVILPD